MIEAKTTFKDSGYDCDHCGGRVLIRTDKETGQPTQECYQCELCHCQWELSGDVLRVGQMENCRQAQLKRQEVFHRDPVLPFSPLLFFVGYGVLAILLIYFGGIVAIRYLIPVTIFLVVGYAVLVWGREKQWW